MKRLLAVAGLITALILAGCGVPAPDVEGQDWCYVFDFTQNPQGFQITSGTWTSQGILSDVSGLLQTSYGYDRFVEPSFVIVTVVRPTGITGDITATAAGNIFGLSATFTATMPDGINEAPLTFQPDELGQAGSDVNITIDASQPIGIESIDVRGMGGSPFPGNACFDGTGTPAPDTPNPTITATATGTPPTSTATSTPGDAPQCIFDFIPDADGWDGLYGGGGNYAIYHSGEGWGRGSFNARIAAGYAFDGTITAITLEFGSTFTGHLNILDADGLVGFATEYDRSGASWTVTGLSLSDGIGLNIFDDSSTAPADLRLTGVTLVSDDCDASTPTPTVSPTPGPTNTPGPTSTFEPLWQCVDFTSADYTFSGTNATYFDNIGWQSTAASWIVGRNNIGTGYKKKIKAVFGQAFTGDIRLTDGVSQTTAYKTATTGSTVILDFSDQSWVPRQNFFVQFVSASLGPYTLRQLCWIDEFPYTPTPGPTTIGTRTPIASGTPRPAPSRTPIQVPVPIILITSTAGVPITTTPIYGGTGVYQPTGTPYGTPIGTPGNSDTGFGSGGGGFGDVGDMIGFGWDIGWGLLGTMIAYVQQAGSMLGDLVTAFQTATPQPIPGLPQCMSNPMAHDICAIYYILDWTLLAPGTAGAFIIPLLMTIIGIWSAIYFVYYVLKLISSGESITNAP